MMPPADVNRMEGGTEQPKISAPASSALRVYRPQALTPQISTQVANAIEGGTSSGSATWKKYIWGWVFLVMDCLVMLVVYLQGEGRIVGETEDGTCEEGEGPPYLALILAARSGGALFSQCVLFLVKSNNSGYGEKLKTPDAAVFKAISLLGPNSDMLQFDIIRWALFGASTALYTVAPLYVDSQAVCFDERKSFKQLFLIMGILLGVFVPCFAYPTACGVPDYPCCARLPDDADWEDHQELRQLNSANFIVKIDSLLAYVSVWANYTQSGPIALVFAVSPTFELMVDWLGICVPCAGQDMFT